MGDPNGQVELSCPGCATTFHLRPRKAKMPRNPIPCPKCGTSIEISDEQMAALREIVGTQTPSAQVLKGRTRSSVDESALDEMERLADELENTKPRVSSTLIGHPISIAKEDFKRDSPDHKTRESAESVRRASQVGADLGERPKTSEIPKEEVEAARASMLGRIKPKKQPTFSSFGADEDEVDTAESERNVHNATTSRPPGMPPLNPPPLSEIHEDSEIHEEKTPAKGKVPLSELLKKVRNKRDTEGIAIPQIGQQEQQLQPESSSSESLSPSTDEVFDDIVDDVVGGATEKLTPVRENAPGGSAPAPSADIGAPSSTGRTESSMLSRLKKIPRSGLREKPGMAGERRGSGYIRLPETEILDLLGEGKFRLRVDDIVYEPIGDEAIIGLVKAGKLKGKDEIAESDGDWSRLETHPLFIENQPEVAEPEAPAPKPPEAEADDESEVGKSTKPMFGAVKPKPPADEPGDSSEEIPPPIKKRTSSTSGEWVQTNLDSTLDNLPVAGPNTPPPKADASGETEAPAEEAAADVPAVPEALDSPDASVSDASPELEEPAGDAGPNFDDAPEEDYKLDGPPSYPAIPLPEEEPESDLSAPMPIAPKKKSSVLPIIAGFIVLGGIVAGAGFLYTSGSLDALMASGNETPAGENTPATTPSTTATAGAETTPEEPPPEPTREEKIATATSAGDWATALPLLEEAWEEAKTPETALQLIEANIQTGQFRKARLLVFQARKLESADREALDQKFDASLTAQAEAERDVVEITPDWQEFELFSSRPLNYRVVDADGNVWRFIPSQDDGVTPRAEVAFYQLCGVVDCGFEVPRTVPARVSKDTLEGLAKDGVSLAAIDWSSDGFTSGALREAVEEKHVGYPIEDTGVWRNWLDSGDDPAELQKPFSEALSAFDDGAGEKLGNEAGDVTTAHVARQIANILSADFLVNNFDRFSSTPGSTVRLYDGQLVSVTNSAAFQPRESNRVRGRFGWTSRFGADFVESVRRLDRESVDPVLFPDASRGEKARLDVFWDQRDKFLGRVDSLVDRRSRETVLPF